MSDIGYKKQLMFGMKIYKSDEYWCCIQSDICSNNISQAMHSWLKVMHWCQQLTCIMHKLCYHVSSIHHDMICL